MITQNYLLHKTRLVQSLLEEGKQALETGKYQQSLQAFETALWEISHTVLEGTDLHNQILEGMRNCTDIYDVAWKSWM